MGTSETSTECSESKEFESVYSKMIPNEKIDISKPVESYKHLYERDVGHEAIKQVTNILIFLSN